MNELLRRGIVAYKVVLRNKLAMSLMMLFSGVMMFIAAMQGRGNDTKTMPLFILLAGIAFSFWAFYRIGYLKSNYDRIKKGNVVEIKKNLRVNIFMQIIEALAYVIVTAAGVFLLTHENFTNIALNLMAGGFTIFNGVIGATRIYKGREKKNFRWVFTIVLTVFEFALGLYFVIAARSINIDSYKVMGVLTTIAGIVEVIAAIRMGGIKSTIQDSKEIIEIMKDGKSPEE